MIYGVQIIAILFALGMGYLAYTHYRRKEFNGREVSFWMLLWIGFIFITIFPNSVDFLVRTFQLNRTLDLVMIIGFFVVIALTFRNYYITERLERKLEDYVRSEALKELKKKDG